MQYTSNAPRLTVFGTNIFSRSAIVDNVAEYCRQIKEQHPPEEAKKRLETITMTLHLIGIFKPDQITNMVGIQGEQHAKS